MENLMQSLPGILLAGGVVTALFALILFPVIYRSVVGRKEAARMDAEVPALLGKLGFEVAGHKIDIEADRHEYEGELKGYRVEFDSGSESMVQVRLKRPIHGCLSTSDLGLRPRRGQATFDFRDPGLNRLFKTRYASSRAAAWLSAGTEGLGALREFAARRGRDLAYFQVEGDRLAARFGRGWEISMGLFDLKGRDKHGRPYCLTEDLQELLDALPGIAGELDAASPEEGPVPDDDDDFDF